MERKLKSITNYLDYLIENTGMYVSVHFNGSFFESLDIQAVNALIPYNSHNSPYCRFVKSEAKKYSLCLLNQKKLMEELAEKEYIEYTCHASVSEVAYPVRKEGKVIGYAVVSGFREDTEPSFDTPIVPVLNSTHIAASVSKRLTDSLIPPLCIMLEALIAEAGDRNPTEHSRILTYVSENHTTVSLDSLASHFGRSRSHISHLFRKMTGKTLKSYCNELKLFTATKLLSGTEMSVTEIALESGFEDTSYFVKLFKEKYGVTPYKYKKSHLTS